MKRIYVLALSLAAVFAGNGASAQESCYGRMSGDTLIVGNDLVERRFVWNGGNLMTLSLEDKATGAVHVSASVAPDFVFTSDKGTGVDGKFGCADVPQTAIMPAHKKVTVS